MNLKEIGLPNQSNVNMQKKISGFGLDDFAEF